MKTIISGIKVTDINPTFEQMLRLGEKFKTKLVTNDTDLQIKCFIKMKTYKARAIVADVLNCKFGQIRIKYHEKETGTSKKTNNIPG